MAVHVLPWPDLRPTADLLPHQTTFCVFSRTPQFPDAVAVGQRFFGFCIGTTLSQ
jgi:hypothetical protein